MINRALAILILLAFVAPSLAQTATPTPLSPVIGESFWRAKDMVAPEFFVSGFTLTTANNRQSLNATASGSRITFWVYEATQIVVWYQHRAGGKDSNNICINWIGCTTFSTSTGGGSVNDPALVPFGVYTFDFSQQWTPVTITTTNGTGTLAIEAIQVLTGEFVTATPIPTITPFPTPGPTPTEIVFPPTPTPIDILDLAQDALIIPFFVTPSASTETVTSATGQVGYIQYVATAGDVLIIILLSVLTVISLIGLWRSLWKQQL